MTFSLKSLMTFLMLTSGLFAHPVYVSMCQLNVSEDGEYLDLKVTIFSDDLELAIYEQDSLRLYLGSDAQLSESEDRVLRYLIGHLFISVDEKQLTLNSDVCESLDIRKARTKIQFRLPLPKAASTLSLKNTLLLDAIEDQVNMLRLNIAGEKKAASLNKKETAISFNIAGSG